MRLSQAKSFLFLFLLSACDPIHGVQTTAHLAQPVDRNCIEAAIKNTPGSGLVKRGYFEGTDFEIAPHWGPVTTSNDFWSYYRGATLEVVQSGESIDYTNGLWHLGKKIPADQIISYLPLMNAVNERIEADCAIPLSAISRVSRF